jgi:hypothetical protein
MKNKKINAVHVWKELEDLLVPRLVAKGLLRLAERSRAGHVAEVRLPEALARGAFERRRTQSTLPRWRNSPQECCGLIWLRRTGQRPIEIRKRARGLHRPAEGKSKPAP